MATRVQPMQGATARQIGALSPGAIAKAAARVASAQMVPLRALLPAQLQAQHPVHMEMQIGAHQQEISQLLTAHLS